MFTYISLYTTPPSNIPSIKEQKEETTQIKATGFKKKFPPPNVKIIHIQLASPSLIGLASHIANGSRRVHRHRSRLANADSPKALVRRSLEGALSEDVAAAVEGGRDEDVGDDDVVGGCE